MGEEKYEIMDGAGIVLATNMDLDTALCLIRGYVTTYYNMHIKLTIREIVKTTESDH